MPQPAKLGGWGLLPNTKKAHYYLPGRPALCFMYFQWSGKTPLEDTDHSNPNRCKNCEKKRKAIEQRAQAQG